MSYTSPKIHFHRKLGSPGIRYLDYEVTIQGVDIDAPFRWDGASSPRMFRNVIGKFDRSIYSSCLHDFLCRRATNRDQRKRADELYRVSLVEDDKCSAVTSYLGYLGARIGAFFGSGVRYKHTIKDKIWPVLGLK